MHMSDTLLSPAVGGAFWVAAGVAIAYSSRRLGRSRDERAVPLMGVLGAFVFAAQMINFAIPGTGSSGHLAGAMLLALLLGPHAAFLAMASVLTVQALFFADGGLLALGANIVNLALLPCYVVYPLVYRPLAGAQPDSGRARAAAFVSAVLALQLGALGVVTETTLSGIAELPFAAFAAVMQPIHLAIGVAEGLITVAVVGFVRQVQPDLLIHPAPARAAGPVRWRKAALALGLAAGITGGVLGWFASAAPDGLEWSIGRLATAGLPERAAGIHGAAARLQERIALLPDYAFPGRSQERPGRGAPNAATTVSGLTGGLLTLLAAAGLGWALRRRAARAAGPVR